MPKYFLHFASYNAPTNALHREAVGILQYYDRRLIDDRAVFISGLSKRFHEENLRHSRCTPLDFRTYSADSTTTGITLGHRYTVGFYLYLVKEDKPNA